VRGSAALFHLAVARPLRAHPAIPQFRSPLPLPRVLQPIRRDSAADYYEIAQREASVEIIPGMRTRIWGYDGIFPGPTIEARRGRAAVVTHTNRLGVPTVTHLHGGVTRPQSDGFPIDTVAPGETRTYQYDNVGRLFSWAASCWRRS
jgi:spore coat protein A, manganese oxidase